MYHTNTHALHGRESESDYVYYHLINYIPGFVKVTTFHSDNQIRKCRNKKLRAGELVALHSLLDISKELQNENQDKKKNQDTLILNSGLGI